MIVKLVGCDNPRCTNTGEPFSITTRSHTPPYGWVRAKVSSTGTNTLADVEVCSVECITPAVIHALDEQ